MRYKGKQSQRRSKQSKKYNTLPTKLTEKEFNTFFLPFLSLPKRGRKPKAPLYHIFNYILYQMHTGCQWENVPIKINPDTGTREISHTSVWKWFDRWSGDKSFDRAFTGSVRLLHEKKKLRLSFALSDACAQNTQCFRPFFGNTICAIKVNAFHTEFLLFVEYTDTSGKCAI